MQVTTVAVLVVLVIKVEIVLIVEIILPHLVFSLKKITNLVLSPYTWEYYIPLKLPRDTLQFLKPVHSDLKFQVQVNSLTTVSEYSSK